MRARLFAIQHASVALLLSPIPKAPRASLNAHVGTQRSNPLLGREQILHPGKGSRAGRWMAPPDKGYVGLDTLCNAKYGLCITKSVKADPGEA